MICEMIMIGGLSISPCNIEALEVSPLKPQERCIVLMDTGRRYAIQMPCTKVHEKTAEKQRVRETEKAEYPSGSKRFI